MAGSIAFDIFARDHASRTFANVGKAADQTGSRISGLAKKAAIAGAIVGTALIKFGADSVRAFVDADKKQRLLEDAYKRFPRIADVNIASMRAQSKAIEAKTKFDDDDIVASQAKLAAFKLTGAQVQKLTPLLVDYAARTGKSLPDASKVLGKALLGQGKGLKDIGIKFKDTGTLSGNFAELMGGLRTQVGGFATKEGATAAGKADILKNKFGDLQEVVGSQLVPVLAKLTDVGLKMAGWMEKHPGLVKAIAIAVGILAAAFAALTIVMAIFNAVAAANPFVLLALAVVAVGVAVVIAYKKFQTFRDIVRIVWAVITGWIRVNVAIIKGLFKAVTAAARILAVSFLSVLVRPLLTAFSIILHGAAFAFGWIPGIGPKLRRARDAFDAFKDQINGIIERIRGKKTFVLDAHVTQATRNAFALYLNTPSSRIFTTYFQTVRLPGSRLAGFAGGTDYAPGGMALVGERGPEIVNLPRGAQVIPNNRIGSGRGGDVYITVQNVNGVQSTSELFQALQKYAKRNGSIKLSGITA